MINNTAEFCHLHAVYRTWIISDLQQSIPKNAEYCMSRAVDDFKKLDLNCQRIAYLGDAVEGSSLEFLNMMTQMQIDKLGSLGIKTCYVMGNHDFDYYIHHKESLSNVVLPFYETVKAHPSWKTSDKLEDFYFIEEFDDFAFIYLTDHSSYDGSWFAQHGMIQGHKDKYPHDTASYRQLSENIEKLNKPVFTFSHYAFSGGNRPSMLLNQLLPLPCNVKVHFYGHAHIGDKAWAGKNCFRKISNIDDHNIPQIDAASLENIRGNAIRSVFLEIYDNGAYGILFRNHTLQRWDEIYLVNNSADQMFC